MLLFFAAAGIYGALKYRAQIRQARQTAKAPQTSITLLPGWNNQQIADYLQKNNIVSAADFLSAEKSFNLSVFNMSYYPNLTSKPAAADLQGFIFPDTYFIPAAAPSGTNISDIIIEKALDNFSQKITPQIIDQAQSQGLDLYQLITLASIIEKETGASQDDKRIVAGIFYNRLNAGMPLQSDATVEYALGQSNSHTSDQDTQVNSPYNTYLHNGLPPGPICNPSLASIMAAADPIQTSYFYFLTDPKTGQAIYAQTYQEQRQNQQKYLGD